MDSVGRKRAKLTEKATVVAQELENSLAVLGDISRKKMFGGYGIFASGSMFALVTSNGDIYFKGSELNRSRFEEAGCEKFGKMPYFSIPENLLDNENSLLDWAKTSIQIAHEKLPK